MSKQTAVEWLVEQMIQYGLVSKGTDSNNVLFHQAKAMEREQMIDFAQIWQDSSIEKYDCKEDLYNSTYKGGEQ
jgi:hypothetical protein